MKGGTTSDLEHSPECVPLYSSSELIKQGDVFEWRKPEEPWKKWGIVVTADCDLLWNKYRGTLSYVPVISLDSFVSTHWLPEQFDKLLGARVNFALPLVRTILDPSGASELSPEGLVQWLHRDGLDKVLSALSVDKESDTSNALASCSDVISARGVTHDPRTGMETFIRLSSQSRKKKTGDLGNPEWEKLENAMRQLPGDMFFLSSISPVYKEGYVAYLRGIRELHVSQFPATTFDFNTSDVVRIARLTSPYKYRITQQLAAVFSDIGLPGSHVDACRKATIALRERFGPTT